MALRQLLPIPTVSFSDDGWAQIANRSGLPVEARSDVERAASIYKMSDIGSSVDQTRKELADTEKALRSGRSGLEKLTANQRAIAVLSEARGSTSCSKTPLVKARTDLAEAIEKIDDIVNYISSGRSAIKRSKPGAREASLRVKLFLSNSWTIFSLPSLKITYHDPLTRNSPAEYIAAVCEAADLQISKYSIDGAIRQITKTRGGN